LEKALEGKRVGDKIEITLKPEEAYGERDPEGLRRLPIKHLRFLRGGKKPKPGMIAGVETNQGKHSVIILKVGKFNVDVDFNHPLAGRTLYYEVEVVSVRDASEEEIAHGHVHGAGGHGH
jgi:FKBP-type peptidyl-prolyl cis-trans isomerase SlyD